MLTQVPFQEITCQVLYETELSAWDGFVARQPQDVDTDTHDARHVVTRPAVG